MDIKEIKKTRAPRTPNYSVDEINVLVNAVEPHYIELYGKFKGIETITAERKDTLWTIITNQVRLNKMHNFINCNKIN